MKLRKETIQKSKIKGDVKEFRNSVAQESTRGLTID